MLVASILFMALTCVFCVQRFLDTNILPDIEFRIMLAPNTVLMTDTVGAVKYEMTDVSLSCESISFGDGSYRAMVDARMSTGEPLLVPFFVSIYSHLVCCICFVYDSCSF